MTQNADDHKSGNLHKAYLSLYKWTKLFNLTIILLIVGTSIYIFRYDYNGYLIIASVVMLIALIMGGFAIYNLTEYKNRFAKVPNIPNRQKIRDYYKKLFKLSWLIGKGWATIGNFGKGMYIEDAGKKDFSDRFINEYADIFFGDKPITPGKRRIMIKFEKGPTKIIFNDRGGEVNTLVINGHSLLKDSSDSSWPRVWPMMFPFCGRLYNNEYELNGKSYKIDNIGGKQYENNVHGFYDSLKWETNIEDDKLVCKTINNIEKSVWPTDFQIIHTFNLSDNEVVINTKFVNKSSEKMFFNFGHHGAFKMDNNNPVIETEKEEIYKVSASKYSDDLLTETLTTKKLLIDKLDFVGKIYQRVKPRSSWVKVIRERINVILDISDFDTLTFSRNDNDRDWVYIEPWCGYQDYENDSRKRIDTKPQIIKLDGGKVKEFNFAIKVEKR